MGVTRSRMSLPRFALTPNGGGLMGNMAKTRLRCSQTAKTRPWQNATHFFIADSHTVKMVSAPGSSRATLSPEPDSRFRRDAATEGNASPLASRPSPARRLDSSSKIAA